MRSMSAPIGPHDEQGDERRQREQQAYPGELEAAYLVQVDDVERHDQAVADEVDDDRREQVLALARQVLPEGPKRRPVAGCGGRRHQATLSSRSDTLKRISAAAATSDSLRGGGFA